MGRTKTKKQASSKVLESSSTAAASPSPSIDSLLQKSQSLIIQCDYTLAARFIHRVLDQKPSNPHLAQAKEMLGVVQLELGDVEDAKQTFQTLLPPHPDAPDPPPPSAHLFLAQLNDDDPQLALKHYQAAVELLSAQLSQLESNESNEVGIDGNNGSAVDEEQTELKHNIVRALIGQVEIWMDPAYDLCFDPSAPETCESLLNSALQLSPNNSEALQTLASVRMSQQRPEDAKACLELAWKGWKDLDLDSPHIPPLPSRLTLVKLFLELSLYSPALQVLHGIMASDDEEVEAWYLEGWCYYMMAEEVKAKESGTGATDERSIGKETETATLDADFDGMTWEELAKDARDRLETCQMLHIHQEHPDKPLLEHVQELIRGLEGMGIQASPPGEDEDDDDEWVDGEDESDEDGDVEMS
ncbi:hypothetical protein BDP27DRAFT_1423668 [Rhodocollybia butyracea]|uniref:TPR-like protein n=1 Tax=Rhodocollybia butyracea TaxID=206335 RepID=A0A9P5PP14_9AGAR|nr:hypothetical protein BDP27DRAFT_1423668 [Rhodocollybia butyracea]